MRRTKHSCNSDVTMKEMPNNINIFQRLATSFFSERAAPISPNSPDDYDDVRSGKSLNDRLEDFRTSLETERVRDRNVTNIRRVDRRGGRRQEDSPQPPRGILTNKTNIHPKECNIDLKISILRAQQESALSSSASNSSIVRSEPGRATRVGILLDLLLNSNLHGHDDLILQNSRDSRRPTAAAKAAHRHSTTAVPTAPMSLDIATLERDQREAAISPLQSSINSKSTRGTLGADSAQVSKRCQDMSPSTSNAQYPILRAQQESALSSSASNSSIVRSEPGRATRVGILLDLLLNSNLHGHDDLILQNSRDSRRPTAAAKAAHRHSTTAVPTAPMSLDIATLERDQREAAISPLQSSINSKSTRGTLGADSAQVSKRCQDMSPSTSNAQYLTANGAGHNLGSSYDSKLTLSMVSTGTAKDATRRHVPRLGRPQAGDHTSDTDEKPNTLQTSDLLQRYLQNKNHHQSDSSPNPPTQRGGGRRPSGKKPSYYAKRKNSLEDHVQTITVTDNGTADRRVSDITMFDNDWDDNRLEDELGEVQKELDEIQNFGLSDTNDVGGCVQFLLSGNLATNMSNVFFDEHEEEEGA